MIKKNKKYKIYQIYRKNHLLNHKIQKITSKRILF